MIENKGKSNKPEPQIIIDVRSLTPGKWSGVENYSYNIIKNLIKISPYEIFLFFNSSEKKSQKIIRNYFPELKKNFLFTRVPNRFFNFTCGILRSPQIDVFLKEKFSKLKNPKIFFCPDPRPTPLSEDIKKIITFHDLSLEKFPEHFSKKTRMWKKILRPELESREAKEIISPSNFTKSELRNVYGVSPKKITVIPHGLPDKRILKDTKRENFILTLGCANSRKNIPRLINSFFYVRKKFPNLTLKIVGEKRSSIFDLQNLEEKEGVEFLGFVSEEEKWNLIRKARAFVFPSIYEGFGIPILEAFKAKTPMALSDISVFREIAGSSVSYFDPENEISISKGIEDALLSSGSNISSKRFITWKACAERTLEVFERNIT